jgi:small-conductance mechanosensitive channel
MRLRAPSDPEDTNWDKVADWFVGTPLTIVCILVGAVLSAWLARRFIRRTVYRLVAPDPSLAQAGLRRIGLKRADEALGALTTDPRRQARATSISIVVGSAASVLIWVVAVILVIGELGIDLAPLIAGAGIAGVALGFGAQNIVKDCLAGLFTLIEDQYGIGDVVDLGEATGTVEEISLRRTVLRGVDGTVWHVPNGEVQRVGNMSQLWSVAVVDVTVAYDVDVERVTSLVQEAANVVCESEEFAESVLEAANVLGVESLGVEGITIRLTVKTVPGTQWALQRALRQGVSETLGRNGIEMPFPQRTVWMKNNPDSTPG